MSQQVRVTFQPSGRVVYVLPGTSMLEAGARAGLTIQTPCGGSGTCGKCRVQVRQGACEPASGEKSVLTEEQIAAGWRLACQTAISRRSEVTVPPESLFASQQQILAEAKRPDAAEVLPGARKVYLELENPALADAASDLVRLERRVGPFEIDLQLLRRLPRRLRKFGLKGTAVLCDRRLIDFEEGDTTNACYGVAFDIGTTTLVASLLDLNSGEEVAIASRMNPQVSLGDDVLSRIRYAADSQQHLEDLRLSIVTAVAEMIEDLCQDSGVARKQIYEAAFAGNTTMEHLLCGLDVEPLGSVPFTPVHGRGLSLTAAEMGLPIHRRGTAYVFPVISGFVGGDAVAGALATQLDEADGPVLMIDIGTNGEIMLSHQGQLYAASTAAGPAFEGARISCGMRATAGAIEKVVFDGDEVRLSVIANVSPVGLCGSGLVDVAAGMLDAGIVTPEGRMLSGDELPESVGEPLRKCVAVDEGGQPRFILAERHEEPVVLTQRDIRELQLATGAVRAGVKILLRTAGLDPGDLERVLIAGGFGSFIRRSHAQRIGLLPEDVEHNRISYVGNTSLNGARWALLSTRARRRAEHLARHARHVQLSQDASFQMEFAEAMIFPRV